MTKIVTIETTNGPIGPFRIRKGPWAWRDFVCFVKDDAPDDQCVTYVPASNIDTIESESV